MKRLTCMIGLAVLLLSVLALPGVAQTPLSSTSGAPAQVGPQTPAGQPLPPALPSLGDLSWFLQTELDDIALLAAQVCALQQHGDTVGAALISGYLLDHRMQADRLRQVVPNANSLTPRAPYDIGRTRETMLALNWAESQQAITRYRSLYTLAENQRTKQLAALGLNDAIRHYDSLTIAAWQLLRATAGQHDALVAALQLEQMRVADLQTQAAQLRKLGDAAEADQLLSLVPAHQQQISSLRSVLGAGAVSSTFMTPPPPVPLATRAEVLTAERAMATQMAFTYVLAAAQVPQGSQLYAIALSGYRNAQQALALPALRATV